MKVNKSIVEFAAIISELHNTFDISEETARNIVLDTVDLNISCKKEIEGYSSLNEILFNEENKVDVDEYVDETFLSTGDFIDDEDEELAEDETTDLDEDKPQPFYDEFPDPKIDDRNKNCYKFDSNKDKK